MVERYDGESLPPAHPVQDGRAPLPDGQGLPQPPRELPLATSEFVWGVVAVVIVVAAVVVGVLR